MSRSSLRTVSLPDGATVPCLGLGTWGMGEQRRARRAEADALRLGLDLGMTLIDTAEMYGDGGAEEVVGEAIRGRRDPVFVVTKVYPHNATRRGTPAACERSLRRLGIDAIDLYLLHWRGNVPLAETVEAMERLVAGGKIRRWGVSNFDVDDMDELFALAGGSACVTDQVLYSLARRAAEWALLPSCAARRVPLMAYSPVDQGRLLANAKLKRIATEAGVGIAQLALAWTLRRPDVISIPKASAPAHVRDNRAAHDLVLDDALCRALDAAFPPPRKPTRLAML